jgi:malonate decarboxylase beta subunit
MNVATLAAEQYRLVKRIERFGACADAVDVWRSMGATEPQAIPALAYQEFVALADRLEEPAHDAR